MMTVVVKSFSPPPLRVDEVMRYGGIRAADAAMTTLVDACVAEAWPLMQYRACYAAVPFTLDGETVDFGFASVRSASLASLLDGCDKAVLMAATVGLEMDRLIAAYGRVSPSKAVIFDALGTERIESLCDALCDTLAAEFGDVTDRFSPGYGDLPLTMQSMLFSVLDCPRKIGLTLGDSLLMSPSKSVTAVVGVGKKGASCRVHDCHACSATTCIYRR